MDKLPTSYINFSLDMAVDILAEQHSMSHINAYIQQFGKQRVMDYAGDRLNKLGYVAEDFIDNNKVLVEEVDDDTYNKLYG